jgi:hypothetical protein
MLDALTNTVKHPRLPSRKRVIQGLVVLLAAYGAAKAIGHHSLHAGLPPLVISFFISLALFVGSILRRK